MDADEFNKFLIKKLKEGNDQENGSDEIFTNEIKLDKIFNATVLNRNSDIYKDMITCLRDQSLVSGWTHVTKSKIFYCTADDVVPYANSKELMQLFEGKYEGVKCYAIGHKSACFQFMARKW